MNCIVFILRIIAESEYFQSFVVPFNDSRFAVLVFFSS